MFKMLCILASNVQPSKRNGVGLFGQCVFLVMLLVFCCVNAVAPIVLGRKHEQVQLRYLEKPGLKRPLKRVDWLPSCLNATVGVAFRGLVPVDAGLCRGSKCVSALTDIHIGFYDSHPGLFHEPDFVGMMRIVGCGWVAQKVRF